MYVQAGPLGSESAPVANLRRAQCFPQAADSSLCVVEALVDRRITLLALQLFQSAADKSQRVD